MTERVPGNCRLKATFRRRQRRTVAVDAKLLHQISDKDLMQSHIEQLAEELGVAGRHKTQLEEVALVITDWNASMPKEITDILVRFLESRCNDPSQIAVVHLDLHGKLPQILDALLRNREFFESAASSVETLEISLDDADPTKDFLPLFPNLCALRLYRPEFPSNAGDQEHLGLQLLRLNAGTLQDVAIVAVNSDCDVFKNVITRLPGA